MNAADTLPDCLACLAGAGEIIVVDGGSTDATLIIARALGAKTITAPRGRGAQLRAGAALAESPYVLLLHADTRLSADWAASLDPLCAGYFTLHFASTQRAARILEHTVAWRCRLFALPYGDQGLLISRLLLDSIGGVPDLPLMEDVALARRLGRKHLRASPAIALTSAARYERAGFLPRVLRNALCLTLYYLNVPLPLIQKLYG